MITIHNIQTGEIIEREMNAAELAQTAKDEKAEKDRTVAEAKKATDKTALLAKLGITEDEARLLLK
jgi:hypothetical protein